MFLEQDLAYVWQSLLTFVTEHLPYISPFWGWVAWAIPVAGLAVVMGWAFPALRGFAGAVLFGVVAGLTGYRRGQYDQYHHDDNRRD